MTTSSALWPTGGGGGGLTVTPVTAAAISGQTLTNNLHYVIDMSAAVGNISVNLPAVTSGYCIWLSVVKNKTNGYRVTINPNGVDVMYYNGASYANVTLYLLESWLQLMGGTGQWFIDDPSDGGTSGSAPLSIASSITASPSTADPSWSGVSATVSTTTTSGQLPLEGIINSAIAITSSVLGGYGRIRWTIPSALKGRRYRVNWHQIASSLLSGDFKIEVYTNTASNYSGTYTKLTLTTDVGGVSSLPNIDNYYSTWFTTDPSLSYYEMRIVRTVASSATIYLANVIVAPIVEVGAEEGMTIVTSAMTASIGDTLGVDSTGGAFIINAPANPMPGDRFRVIDIGGVANTNNISIAGNGANIAGLATNLDIDINWLDTTLTYYNATVGWSPSR